MISEGLYIIIHGRRDNWVAITLCASGTEKKDNNLPSHSRHMCFAISLWAIGARCLNRRCFSSSKFIGTCSITADGCLYIGEDPVPYIEYIVYIYRTRSVYPYQLVPHHQLN